jgi:predicted lysophospholipase L1 biosynthesis ABC-type transport system permease subunit
VINETMAERFWPNEDPIDRTFRFGPPSLQGPVVTVIGVVGSARQRALERPAEPHFYFSAYQFPVLPSPDMNVVVRTAMDPMAIASSIRALVVEGDKHAIVSDVSSMDAVMTNSLTGRRNNLMLLIVFSALALLLTAVGLYGTTAYIVAQRTQEIGVRMAVGAAKWQIYGMVIREGAGLALIGVGIGVAAALALARVVASMLYGVTTTDVATYVGAAAVLGLVTIAANYVPAWRASRVDPLTALRLE